MSSTESEQIFIAFILNPTGVGPLARTHPQAATLPDPAKPCERGSCRCPYPDGRSPAVVNGTAQKSGMMPIRQAESKPVAPGHLLNATNTCTGKPSPATSATPPCCPNCWTRSRRSRRSPPSPPTVRSTPESAMRATTPGVPQRSSNRAKTLSPGSLILPGSSPERDPAHTIARRTNHLAKMERVSLRYGTETKMHCIKLLGQRLSDSEFDRQVVEFQVRVTILNGFSALGIPVTEATG
jgi:hypothetical protein